MQKRLQRIAGNWLRKISAVLLRLHRAALIRPKLTLGVTVVLLLVSLVFASKLRFLIMIEDLMDQDFQTYSAMEDLRRDFPDKNNLYFILHRKDGKGAPSSRDLCDLLGWMSKASFHQGVTHLFSSFGVRRPVHTESSIRFEPILREKCGGYGDDLGEQASVDLELKEIQKSPFGGFLSSLKADDVVVNLFLRDQTEDLRFGKFDPVLVADIRSSLQNDYLSTHPHLMATWTGIGTYQYFLKKGYDQSAILNLLAVAVILILFRVLYGTWKSGVVFQLSLLITLILVYGWMGWMGYPIDSLSNALPTLAMIATLEDFIFISHLKHRLGKSTRTSFRQMMAPSFFTSLSSAIGFGSLAVSELSIIRRFGVECALASVIEFFVIILVLPALFRQFPSLDRWTVGRPSVIESFAEKISKIRPKKVTSYGALLVFIGLFFISSGLNINDSPEEIFSSNHPVLQSTRFLEQSRGWKSEMSLVFHRHSNEQRNREIIAQLRSGDPDIVTVEDPYSVLDYLKRDSPEQRTGLVSGLWETSQFASRLVTEDQNQSRAILYVRSTDIKDINRLRAKVQKICVDDCHLAGTLNSYGEFGNRVLSTLFSSLGVSLALVTLMILFLCLALGQGSVLRLLLASMWGVMALLCCFLVFKVKIFFVTSIVASIVVGLAGDNTIQFLFFGRRRGLKEGVETLAPAAILISLCMIAVSSVMFFSEFGALRTLGLLMILGFFLMLVGDVWVLKGLMKEK